MAQYNITKIVDGLFISDQWVTQDAAFLLGNKVIRMLGWTAQSNYHSHQEWGIEEFIVPKNTVEVRFPSFAELETGFQFLSLVDEQMLCGLIYSQSQLQASLICIMYLMRKYHWDYSTSYQFLRLKLDMFQCSEQTIDQFEKYQIQLAEHLGTSLSHILWDYQFIADYQAQSDQEMLLITTIKNKMRGNRQSPPQKEKIKKIKRIKWYDQLRPNSAFSISSNKSIGKGTIVKNRLVSPSNIISFSSAPQIQQNNKQLQLLYSSVNFKSAKRIKQRKADQNQWQDNSQYQQLKQMSRTNFNDPRHMSSKLRRRGSLKSKQNLITRNSSSNNLQSINALVGIYGSKGTKGLSRASSAQSFLTGLRNFNKMSINHA